jgi:hypothetical protein
VSITSIAGASVWEQEMYDHLTAHGKEEGATLQSYQELADSTDSPAFAFLARIILDDERRHHQLLDDLAETIRVSAELSGEPTPIPDLAMFKADRAPDPHRDRTLPRVGERGRQEARSAGQRAQGRPRYDDVGLVVRLMRHDNEKHRRILELIRDRARVNG